MKTASIVLGCATFVLSSCSSTDPWLRSQPVIYMPPQVATPRILENLVSLKCAAVTDLEFQSSTGDQYCLYVVADAAKLVQREDPDDQPTREQAINFLMALSDMNCSNFLNRAFANKSGLDSSKKFTQDITSGLAAGTASGSPGVSAGLSVANIIIGKTVDTVNSVYYFDKTFTAMDSAIKAARAEQKAYILARIASSRPGASEHKPYPLSEALGDIRAYDDACSLRAGLDKLQEIADSEKKTSQSTQKEVQLAPNPAQKLREIKGMK